MGPIWGRQNPGGPHVGPMNFAIWAHTGLIKVSDAKAKCAALFLFGVVCGEVKINPRALQ